jgi:hypothetical protein
MARTDQPIGIVLSVRADPLLEKAGARGPAGLIGRPDNPTIRLCGHPDGAPSQSVQTLLQFVRGFTSLRP